VVEWRPDGAESSRLEGVAVPANNESGTDPAVDVLDERYVYDDFFKVKEARLRYRLYAGGMSAPVRRLSLERGDSVAAIIVKMPEGDIGLVEQFKYPTFRPGERSGWIVETVAGMIADTETPDQAIGREIREEIGYDVVRLEHIATFFVSPGGSSERIWLFAAVVDESRRLGPGGGVADEGEDIALRWYTRDRLADLISSGEIEDAKTLIGLMWLRARELT
jgi:nudix-type nucleoside diphosphatase (YffH/AdpP family)